jgi:putative transposase
MALSQSVASELLEAFRAGEGVDLVRESVRLVMQELIETEASERIGADRYERTETRITDRNGSRPRLLATQAGDVQLRIPKLRKGSFFPVILEPRRRIDQALYAVVMEAYVNGVSTRAVDDLVTALGIDSGISKSEVSRICAGLDETVVTTVELLREAVVRRPCRPPSCREWRVVGESGEADEHRAHAMEAARRFGGADAGLELE